MFLFHICLSNSLSWDKNPNDDGNAICSADTCLLNSDTSLAPASGGGKPTLRDYMKMMKETNSDASSVYAAMHGGGGGGTEAAAPSGAQSTAPPSMPPHSAPGMGREGSISPAKQPLRFHPHQAQDHLRALVRLSLFQGNLRRIPDNLMPTGNLAVCQCIHLDKCPIPQYDQRRLISADSTASKCP